ncbi:MAG: Na/Pi cotransporter family protein [Bacteroidales bacterium]|nr:Na/Pi cotransporter family protein [Bacteroidales bacterium]
MTIMDFLMILGCLALLMYGMKTMSEALQKLTGGNLRKVLGAMTANRFTGICTGAFVTASVQSSTATTVLTVSFVNAGLLTLAQAISVIMGANIGTTATAWIMAVFGFQMNMKAVVFPLFALGIALSYFKKSSTKSFGEFLFGFSFLFLGLVTLRENATAMQLDQNPTVISFFTACREFGFITYILFLLLGGILTLCVQSSAAIMAITMILCSTGVADIYQGIALVLGENIGTTITSNIVAMKASTQARRAALAHLTFNLFGVIWVLILFKPFINLVCKIVSFDVHADMSQDPNASIRITYALAGFHTAFNVCNTMILVWFVPQLERFVSRVIHGKEEDEDSRLRYIGGGLLSTAELSILEARKEINVFAKRVHRMFGFVPELLKLTNTDEFSKLYSRIEKYEGISDNMEIEIAKYLNRVSEGRLSIDSKNQIRIMLREISELESIADSCFNMSRVINRKFQMKETFTDEQLQHIHHMFELCERAISQMERVLHDSDNAINPHTSLNIELEINNYRTQLKENNVIDINEQKYDYQTGVNYMDIIGDSEKIGDYAINVVEAHTQTKLTT